MDKQFMRCRAFFARMLVLVMLAVSIAGCSGKEEMVSKNESEDIEDLQPYPETEMTDMQLQYEDEESSAMLGMKQYINDNLKLMGMYYTPPFEFDVTGDGHPDLCTNLTRGSGIVSTDIVVYDSFRQKGYVLPERGEFDFFIQGVGDVEIKVLKRQNYPRSLDDELDEFRGVLVFEDDALGFVEKK